MSRRRKSASKKKSKREQVADVLTAIPATPAPTQGSGPHPVPSPAQALTRAPASEAGLGAAEQTAAHRHGLKWCPHCGEALQLVHRRKRDRIASFVIPSHRWLCESCGWSGLRVDRHELKHLKRRVGVLLLILLAALLGFVVMWYLDNLK
jgi:predicted RNA-binding Zn-ribbon protein involved in translation (DUF1610 family)